MRIVAGDFKGRIFKFPRSKLVRPTQEKVRKAIFDILAGKVEGRTVLDLFSGSGAMGFEALSRKAKSVTFVENKSECIKALKGNIAVLKVFDRCRIIPKDVFVTLKLLTNKGLKFDLIFADPPYYQGLAKKYLLNLDRYDILDKNSIIVIEHYKKDGLPTESDCLLRWQLRRYSDTFVSFYSLK